MPIIGWIANILGWLMNGIFNVLDAIGIPNVGLAIILFTLIMYLLMTPLQIKQQKFSKLNAVMSPELQKIQKKYKGKNDQTSMMKMQEETQAVYQKYGVSPTGSCLQLVIQMPVLFALYQVIYHIPGYITKIGDMLNGLAAQSGFMKFFVNLVEDNKWTVLSTGKDSVAAVVDGLYKLSPSQWNALAEAAGSKYDVATVHSQISQYTNFLGMNLSDTPLGIIKDSFAAGSWLLIIAAVLIPILAWFTQWLNYKLMPQPAQPSNQEASTMESTMKSMNTFMPIMSAFFCLTFAVGIGVYWIAGAVVRSIQQVVINRHMDKMNIDDLINENMEKMNKKRAKQGLPPQKITNQAKLNVRNLESLEERQKEKEEKLQKNTGEQAKASTDYYKKTAEAKPGSLASKANMVKQYNEKSNKK